MKPPCLCYKLEWPTCHLQHQWVGNSTHRPGTPGDNGFSTPQRHCLPDSWVLGLTASQAEREPQERLARLVEGLHGGQSCRTNAVKHMPGTMGRALHTDHSLNLGSDVGQALASVHSWLPVGLSRLVQGPLPRQAGLRL